MLRLKDICKSYTTGDFTQKALDGVSVDFRKNEFVAILGPSGCGKTTLLNIVGGLDHYDSGDLEIFGKSTKNFKDREWDAYRNNSIGFIFQSHNLISHLSLLQNVELGLSLSGVNRKERRKRAIEVLNQVGLTEHIKKKPNQLSGGQSQRVAIARALANNPDIVLADEPTGSLDSVTSVQVMEIIKEISREKLVVMVTHNQELADKYATRIIRLKDGKIIDDSNPVSGNSEMKTEFSLKKTAMSYWTALVSSLNNIRTKLGRTILTAFAGSIGIIGIALILSLSNGLDDEISSFEADTIAGYPISITSSRIDYDKLRNLAVNNMEKYPDDDFATFYHPVSESSALIPNTITEQYVDWVRDYAAGAGAAYVSGVKYVKYVDMSLLRQNGTSWSRVYSEVKTQTTSPSSTLNQSITGPFFNRLPEGDLLSRSYDLLYGEFPISDPDNKAFEVVLVVDPYNRIYDNTLSKLGFANIGSEEGQQSTFDFSEIVGREFKLYVGAWSASVDMNQALDIKISGIVRLKKGSTIGLFYNGLGFPAETFEYIYQNAPDSVSTNIESIYIYANSFEDKDIVKAYLDSYNDYYGYGIDSLERIEYVDLAGTFTSMIRGVLDTISIVLVGFAAISLVVSSIMIAIITYISVLERTKEIGVLRALGARKIDVSRVFNSENLIIGLVAGFVGVMVGFALTIPANMIIDYYAGMPDVAELRFIDALVLNIISIVLAFLSGFIPARIAAKKDPVIALRTE